MHTLLTKKVLACIKDYKLKVNPTVEFPLNARIIHHPSPNVPMTAYLVTTDPEEAAQFVASLESCK